MNLFKIKYYKNKNYYLINNIKYKKYNITNLPLSYYKFNNKNITLINNIIKYKSQIYIPFNYLTKSEINNIY